MIASLIMIALVLIIAYLQSIKGFFSAMITMLVVIISGAVAFAVWEPVAYLLLDNITDDWMAQLAWGSALVAPFALCVVILSALTNALIRANVKCDNLTNWVGGALCGLVSAVISVGIACIGISNTRQGQDAILGYQSIEWDSTGSIVSKGGLMFPVDTITEQFYGFLSENAMSSETPLSVWRPRAASYGQALNLQPGPDVAVKFTVKPGDITVQGRYTVGQTDEQAQAKDLIGDGKAVITPDGMEIKGSASAYVEGYLLQFGPGAREKSGQISIAPGQFLLVLRDAADTQTLTLHPFAMISQAKGDLPLYGRFRFDGKDVFLGSTGNTSTPASILEFLVPRDGNQWRPIALYAKGIRVAELVKTDTDPATDAFPPVAFDSRDQINNFTNDGRLYQEVRKNQITLQGSGTLLPADAIIMSNRLGRIIINKSNLRGLEVNEKNLIIDGQGTFVEADKLMRGGDRDLIVQSFFPGEGSMIVQVDVGRDSALALTGDLSRDVDGAMILEDTSGQRFQCIGYVYEDRSGFRIRFTPGAPIRAKNDLPNMSASRDDQKMTLVFRISVGVSISRYAIGEKVIATFEPAVKAEGGGQDRGKR